MQVPAVELQVMALIASIATPVLFLVVLVFQIRATSATGRAARAAEREVARLRPIIKTFDPDLQVVGSQKVPNTLRFRIRNVGQDTAYQVLWTASFYDASNSLITTLKSDWEIDLPPGEDMYQAFAPRHTEWGKVLALLQANISGIRYVFSVTYLPARVATRRFQSVHKGKPEFMTMGMPPKVVGWVWIVDGGYSLDRPADEGLS